MSSSYDLARYVAYGSLSNGNPVGLPSKEKPYAGIGLFWFSDVELYEEVGNAFVTENKKRTISYSIFEVETVAAKK